jgi:hypothetical protein
LRVIIAVGAALIIAAAVYISKRRTVAIGETDTQPVVASSR